ncbi:hypothetical protein B976_01962 [Brucella canis 79/122]|nr:cyclopropane-fatty-acyl-phospholipid synthase [Brucella canis HSK A52141]ENS47768.1 hypothetical protein B976_01962 [Brucella canis 79/122]ENX72112.1 hypothetical protein C982_00354 [Brucella canis F7/05A]ERU08816.1 hypothetical protein P036_00294 [Brucella canis 04-2330-1]
MYGMLHTVLTHMIKTGDLTVTDADGSKTRFGDRTGTPVHVHFKTAHAQRAVAFNPELKLAECFMDGEIDFLEGDIYTLLQVVFENTGPTAATEPWMKAAGKLRVLFRRFQQMNTIHVLRAISKAITTFRASFTTCSSIPTNNIPAPISIRRTQRWPKRSLPRSATSQRKCW